MTQRLKYTFRCPICEKRFTYDQPGEPCCTGPSEMRDDHPMETMRLVSIAKTEVAPDYAEQRAGGVLILPHMEKTIAREVRLLRV